MKRILLPVFLIGAVCSVLDAQPRLIRNGSAVQLEVSGKPMLIFGGELGNSSASTLADCRRTFPKLSSMGLNTVLSPASWELIEPVENSFDFTSIKNVIDEARANDLKVVFLWFGAWKNSMSCYAPEWFKRDTGRFPRVHLKNGMPLEEASSLSRNVRDADCRAFCRLMSFIREYDASCQTVIMVQLENEIGMVNAPRDYSKDATSMYEGEVPSRLVDYLKTNASSLHPYLAGRFSPDNGRTWAGMFGDDIYSEEIFQAWTYAEYVEHLASAGKSIYNIPIYVNVALDSRGRKPGEYPSAGPLAQLVDIWHCGAPSIDILALDLYDKGFRDWTSKYHLPNNPLFIPEIRLEDQDGVRALYVFGHHDAIGFCPFSIEDYQPDVTDAGARELSAEEIALEDQLNRFTSGTRNQPPLVASYRLLRQLEPLILKYQGTDNLSGIHLDNELRQESIVTPDGIRLTVRHSYSLGWEAGAKDPSWPEVGCLIVRLGAEDYIVAGSGVVITYEDDRTKGCRTDGECVGLAKCELIEYPSPGKNPTILRHLNGDQTHQGRHVRIPVGDWQIQHFKLYRY